MYSEVSPAGRVQLFLRFGKGIFQRLNVMLTGDSLENDIIVLRGSENESSSQLLKGVVVLCLPASLKIEDVHLKLSGQLKVG
jgi:hypothetical protein